MKKQKRYTTDKMTYILLQYYSTFSSFLNICSYPYKNNISKTKLLFKTRNLRLRNYVILVHFNCT